MTRESGPKAASTLTANDLTSLRDALTEHLTQLPSSTLFHLWAARREQERQELEGVETWAEYAARLSAEADVETRGALERRHEVAGLLRQIQTSSRWMAEDGIPAEDVELLMVASAEHLALDENDVRQAVVEALLVPVGVSGAA